MPDSGVQAHARDRWKIKSRRLEAPPGSHTRPTSDRLRETLFNVVAPRMEDSVWLDLFAGSGAIGIEALSRGARSVYFVESSARPPARSAKTCILWKSKKG